MPSTNSHFISSLALSSLDGNKGVTLNGNAWSIAGAGDVNGDGIDDMVIGDYLNSPGVYQAGSTYLIFGHKDPWDISIALSNATIINGIVGGDRSGYSVASAGDMNGDNITDFVIGAPDAGLGGSTYLIFGHRGVWNNTLPLASLNGINGIVINGIAAGDRSGSSAASAGDVNGDGFDDLLIGAPQRGSIYIVFGHGGAWSTPLALGSLNGSNGVIINGALGDRTGHSVAGALDANGDGFKDILIGAPGSFGNVGGAYLVFGHGGVWDSPLPLASLNGTNGVAIMGIFVNDGTGGSVAAGDVNGDAISDLLIGAPAAAPDNLPQAGSTYLIFGHTIWTTPLLLSSLNGTNGAIINSKVPYDYSGCAVVAGGDMNGDGLGDIVIGVYGASSANQEQSGSTYLILGTSTWSSPLVLSSLGTNGAAINGVTAYDSSGNSVAGGFDANGDGLKDLLIATPSIGFTYLVFGDSVDFLANTLTINQGQTLFFNSSMLAAYHPHNLAMNASIPFKISDVTHGRFSTLDFNQSAIEEQLVSFTHDGSIYPPSYEVTVGSWGIASVAATVNFYPFPVLHLSPFSVGQGQTVVLTTQSINASSAYFPADALTFNVSNVFYGDFVKTNTSTKTYQFNLSSLNQGQVSFATDGSANAPSYDISVSDNRLITPGTRGSVKFNEAPILLNNRFILTRLQEKTIVISSDLSARDKEISLKDLIFTPSTIDCHFEDINLPGMVLPFFSQEKIQGNQILFVWDGDSQPFCNMSVSDGFLSTGRPTSITITSASNMTSTVNTESANTGAIVGSVVAVVGGLALLLFGLQCHFKRQTNKQYQKILSELNAEVVCPIANKIFSVINTTGFLGQRSDANTKAYMKAIGKIIEELKSQQADLDFSNMEAVDKESFINQIAKETREQSLSESKGCSFGRCTRYFKPEVTPQEIESVAHNIAVAAASWQKRQKGNVTPKGAQFEVELEKLNAQFSGAAANEALSPEEQGKLYMQLMEQERQQQQQKRKELEAQLAQQEQELASLRNQFARLS